MRSNKPKTITVSVIRGRGPLPAFLPLFQRHFEKACPTVASSLDATITAPLDQLGMIAPDNLLNSIESIEVVYHARNRVIP